MAAPTSSLLTNSFIASFLFSFMFLSASSFNAGAPKPQPHANAAHNLTLCNFDLEYFVGSKFFDNIENCNVGILRACGVDRIYQFGDSISDVGNLVREVPVGAATPFARLPYGSNFPTGPTGRASNGKLMIDYFAMDAGLPLLPPFKKSDADFTRGVNFAVGGATALPSNVLAAMNISSPMTNSSLSVQLDWMSAYFNSICHNQRDCGMKFKNALFILGPFGGSDYYNALFQGKSIDEITKTMLPKIIDAIMDGVRRLISMGAKKVLVPGLHTIFELPVYKTTFSQDTKIEGRDMTYYHNNQLEYAIKKLNKEERRDAVIFFGTYDAAFQTVKGYALEEPQRMDYFDTKACCGTGGGKYNVDLRRMCGAEGVSVCKEPQRKIHWDGLHLTQEAYMIMTKYILYNIFVNLQCPSS